MDGRFNIGIFLAGSVLFSGMRLVAQQPPTPTLPSPPSPSYGGPPLKDPASLAGLWEGSNGRGGIVGIQILLNTHGEAVDTVEFGLFERTGPNYRDPPFNYFDPQGRGADSCHWDGHLLTIDFIPPTPKRKLTAGEQEMWVVAPVHMDLVWDETAGTWSGRFQYKSFDGNVVLRRPAPAASGAPNPLVGLWVNKAGPSDACLHIVQEDDGKLNGWVDSIPVPDRIVVPRSMPQMQMMGHYGDMTKVEATGNNQITVVFNAYSGMCCSHSFAAKLSLDGTLLEGEFLEGRNQVEMAATWSRVTGESCATGNAKALVP